MNEKEIRKQEIAEIEEINNKLQEASHAYYVEDKEIMSNAEYDALEARLIMLIDQTGYTPANSITETVGADIKISKLTKKNHEKPMLSLAKVKYGEAHDEIVKGKTVHIEGHKEGISKFLEGVPGDIQAFLSWKYDGLTCVLTYENGKLAEAVTRGNGVIGEVVTHTAKKIKGIPRRVNTTDRLVIRGEVLMTYEEFERIKAKDSETATTYMNPRNLASGTLRSYNNSILNSRELEFKAFALVEGSKSNNYVDDLKYMNELGFQSAGGYPVTKDNVFSFIEKMKDAVDRNPYPSDGLVLTMNDKAYGESLGTTAKAPKNAIALKWKDEAKSTTLRKIILSVSPKGVLTPVAEFDTIEIEGTNVSRASLHNLSIVESLELGIGDSVDIIKANMIIPQIVQNNTKSNTYKPDEKCPVCGAEVEIHTSKDGIKTMHCPNPHCSAKHIGKFVHFVQRDAMNIMGIAESTLEDLVSIGILKEFKDFYYLAYYKDEITSLEKMGDKSYENIIKAVEDRRTVDLDKLIFALNVDGIGSANAKILAKEFKTIEAVQNATKEELEAINGIGSVLADSIVAFFADEDNTKELQNLLAEISINPVEEAETDSAIAGKTFVITGSVEIWKNRKELSAFIESKGAKVAGSVSAKTDYLINNDNESSSSKNKKAHELGIPIITEAEFQQMVL